MTAPDELPLDEWLEQVQARCDAAKVGPWAVTTCADYWVETVEGRGEGPEGFDGIAHCGDIRWPDFEVCQDQWRANAVFIAEARTDLPRALREIRSLQAERDRWKTAWVDQGVETVKAADRAVTAEKEVDRLQARVSELEESREASREAAFKLAGIGHKP